MNCAQLAEVQTGGRPSWWMPMPESCLPSAAHPNGAEKQQTLQVALLGAPLCMLHCFKRRPLSWQSGTCLPMLCSPPRRRSGRAYS